MWHRAIHFSSTFFLEFHFGSSFGFGGQVKMSIYYRVYKKIGVGISFDKLIGAYLNYKQDEDQNPQTHSIEYSIGKSLIHPRMGFSISF